MTTNTFVMQRTIAQPVTIQGIGLHSGQVVTMQLLPAAANTGLIFKRVDLTPLVDITVNAFAINETMMSTNLSFKHAKVATIEHLMSALAAFGIDNLIVEIDALEIPILDGSGIEFAQILQQTGTQQLNSPKMAYRILKAIKVQIDDKTAELLPLSHEQDGLELNFTINFDHPVISQTQQQASFNLSLNNYMQQLAFARTFGFEKDVKMLKQNNLALGGGLHNAVVVGDDKILNPEGLRAQNEFVMHKILDALGDLYVLGKPIIGVYNAYKSGHALNNQLLRALLADDTNYQLVPMQYDTQNNISYQL